MAQFSPLVGLETYYKDAEMDRSYPCGLILSMIAPTMHVICRASQIFTERSSTLFRIKACRARRPAIRSLLRNGREQQDESKQHHFTQG